MAWGLLCGDLGPSRLALDLECGKAVPRLSIRARHRNDEALHAGVASIITSTSAARLARAGKMMFACNVKNIYAYLLMHFSRIGQHPPEAAGAAPAQGHGLAAERHALTGESDGLAADLTAWRPARPAGETIPLNQEPRTKARGSSRRSNHAPQSSLAAGPARCWLARSCCPCRCSLLPGSCSGPGAGPCLCFCLCLCSCALALLWWQVQGSPRLRSRRGARA